MPYTRNRHNRRGHSSPPAHQDHDQASSSTSLPPASRHSSPSRSSSSSPQVVPKSRRLSLLELILGRNLGSELDARESTRNTHSRSSGKRRRRRRHSTPIEAPLSETNINTIGNRDGIPIRCGQHGLFTECDCDSDAWSIASANYGSDDEEERVTNFENVDTKGGKVQTDVKGQSKTTAPGIGGTGGTLYPHSNLDAKVEDLDESKPVVPPSSKTNLSAPKVGAELIQEFGKLNFEDFGTLSQVKHKGDPTVSDRGPGPSIIQVSEEDTETDRNTHVNGKKRVRFAAGTKADTSSETTHTPIDKQDEIRILKDQLARAERYLASQSRVKGGLATILTKRSSKSAPGKLPSTNANATGTISARSQSAESAASMKASPAPPDRSPTPIKPDSSLDVSQASSQPTMIPRGSSKKPNAFRRRRRRRRHY